MKTITMTSIVLALALLSQGCATTKTQKTAKNKLKIPRQSQSYALMDEEASPDQDIIRRGNKARGTDEY